MSPGRIAAVSSARDAQALGLIRPGSCRRVEGALYQLIGRRRGLHHQRGGKGAVGRRSGPVARLFVRPDGLFQVLDGHERIVRRKRGASKTVLGPPHQVEAAILAAELEQLAKRDPRL